MTFSHQELAVLFALTHFDSPVQLTGLSELTQLETSDLQTALVMLVERDLLVITDDAYSLSRREYLVELANQHQALFVQIAERLRQKVYDLLMECGYDSYAYFPRLHTEWACIVAALPLFMQGDYAQLKKVHYALFAFLMFSGYWQTGIDFYSQGETIALAYEDDYQAGWMMYFVGWFHYHRGQLTELTVATERCETHWRQAGFDADEQARILRLQGIAFELQHDYASAKATYTELLRVTQIKTSNVKSTGHALAALAETERLLGELERAEQHFNEALEIDKNNHDAEGTAAVLGRMAELALMKQDWSNAQQLAEDALARSEHLHRLDYIGANCQRLALALAQQKQHQLGQDFAQRAVQIFTQLSMTEQLQQAQATLTLCQQTR